MLFAKLMRSVREKSNKDTDVENLPEVDK